MIDRYPTSMQSVYLDLLSRHLDQRVTELGGIPKLRRIGGKDYWYAEIAIKGRKNQRYLGPDTSEMRASIERAKSAVEDARAARADNRALVRQLEAIGAPRLDANTGSVLKAMAAVGVFRLGGTLVGTHAFRLYALELGMRLRGLFDATQDVDIAAFQRLSVALDDKVDPSLGSALGGLGIEPAPAIDQRRPTRWRAKGGGLAIDFLAPSFTEEEGPVKLDTFDGWAQGLHFLNYLIADPIQAVALYLDGILVQIPQPERYAVHKLIVAQRRNPANRPKARKDLDQAQALIETLATERRELLRDAYDAAMEAGPKWRAAITASLRQRPEIASMFSFAR